jgi:hypothetical protein
MANLERGFRRLTFAFSVVFASPFVVDGVLSFVEIGRIQYYLLVPTAIRFGILLAHRRSKRVPQERAIQSR